MSRRAGDVNEKVELIRYENSQAFYEQLLHQYSFDKKFKVNCNWRKAEHMKKAHVKC